MKKYFLISLILTALFSLTHAISIAEAADRDAILKSCLKQHGMTSSQFYSPGRNIEGNPAEFFENYIGVMHCFVGSYGREDNGPGIMVIPYAKNIKSYITSSIGFNFMEYRSPLNAVCQKKGAECNQAHWDDGYDCTKHVSYPCQTEAEISAENAMIAAIRKYAAKLPYDEIPKELECGSYEYLIDGECRTKRDLCGDDALLIYDEDNNKCYCPDGYLYENRSCVYEEDPEDCWNDEVLVNGECMSISELCGSDPNISYDPSSGNCFCPSSYVLEYQNGQQVCTQASDVDINIYVISGYPEPPLLADGNTETRFAVYGTDTVSDKPVSLRFEIGYTRTVKSGEISVSGGPGGYTVIYRTADLGEVAGQPVDYLYIYYNVGGEEKVKKHPIELYTETVSNMTISHLGFNEAKAPLVFEGKKTKVFVYTMVHGQKIPVANAKIEYESVWAEHTNSKGIAILKTNKKVYSDKEHYEEVELNLTGPIEKRARDAKRHFDEVDIPYDVISKYITGFAWHLAVADSESEAQRQVAILNNLGYSLLFLNQGNNFAERTSFMVGDTLGDLIWDMIEFVNSLKSYTAKARVGLEQGYSNTYKITEKEYKQMLKLIEELPEDSYEIFWYVVAESMAEMAPHLDPQILRNLMDGLVEDIIGFSAKEFGYNNLSISKMVSNYFYDSHQDFNRELMIGILEKIQDDQFKEHNYITESKIALAKYDYDNFQNSFQFKNKMDYEATFIKDSGDLVRSIVVKGIELTVPSLSQTMKTINTVWDGVDVVLQSGRVSMWYIAFSDNQEMVRDTVSGLMELNLSQNDVQSEYRLASVAYAKKEDDLLKIMYDNRVSGEDPDRQIVLDYYKSKNSLPLYEKLNRIMEIVNKMDPQNEEAQQVKDEIYAQTASLLSAYEQTKDKIDGLDIIKPKKKIGSFGSINILEYVIIMCQIAVIVFFWRKTRGKKIGRRIVIAILIIWIGGFVVGKFFSFSDNPYQESGNDVVNTQNSGGGVLNGADASSILPPESGISYKPEMAVDQNLSTAWVEGVPDSGINQWIEFTFDAPKEISTVSILPGYASSDEAYFKNNRIKQLRVEFGPGPGNVFTLSDEFRTHDLKFDTVTADSVRIIILDVYPGSKFNDTAISEVDFY